MSASSNISVPATQRPHPLKAVPRDRLARDQKVDSTLEDDAGYYLWDRPIPANASRPTNSRDRPALLGGLIGSFLAAFICVVAVIYYGNEVKPAIDRWAQQLVLTASQLLVKLNPAQPSQPGIQVPAAGKVPEKQAPSEPASLAQTVPQEVPPKAGPEPPVLAQLLQTIVRDVTNLEQDVGQLKASHEQMARDNAIVAEQLKTSQEQMARVIAKASEQEDPRPKSSALRVGPLTRKPARPLPSSQAAGRP